MIDALKSIPNLHPKVKLASAEKLGGVDLRVQPQAMALLQADAQRTKRLVETRPMLMPHHHRAEDEVARGGAGAPEVAALVDVGDVHPAGDLPVAGASTPPIT